MACKNEKGKTCGSDDTFSLYKRRNLFNHRNNPVNYHFCMNEEEISSGCQAGQCMAGWTGEFCDKRDCSEDKGACGPNATCRSFHRAESDITECQYPDNYGLNKNGELQEVGSVMTSKLEYIGCFALVVHSLVRPVYSRVLCERFCVDIPSTYLIGLSRRKHNLDRTRYQELESLVPIYRYRKCEKSDADINPNIYDQNRAGFIGRVLTLEGRMCFCVEKASYPVSTKPAMLITHALIDAGSVVPDDAKVFNNLFSLTIELCMKICAENSLPLAYLTVTIFHIK
ncbi:hypothetical protein HELRODRAFT_178958 [Helobdella robusta]|uniref:Uncharacterized protein n=1 Tax=Helobdella robusta TaxID=6412 RepID=T1FDY8_HELRO|nr:hypothetical protein HELRODRAFT_178958 [Helobdella robusta]ESN95777.1 hypothetical protein HELRODRAFT_178958 [Helobdella robusta]